MNIFHAINLAIRHGGLFGVFMVMVIENLGIPFPTEIGFLVASNMITKGQITLGFGILIITLGNVVGSVISYTIGHFASKQTEAKWHHHKKLVEAQHRLAAWFKKYGNVAIFIARIFGYVRPWASLIAGFADVAFGPFLFWTITGSVIFSAFTLFFTKYIVRIWIRNPGLHIALAILALVLFFGLFIFEWGRRVYEKNRDSSKPE